MQARKTSTFVPPHDDNSEYLRIGHLNLTSNSTMSKRNPYMPLHRSSLLMAHTLFCIPNICFIISDNNYDVNMILGYYLRIWYEDNKKDSISASRLALKFSPPYGQLVQSYFADNVIYYDDFFVFVSLFTFFEQSRILIVLLSINQVFSNLFITQLQVVDFIRRFGLESIGIKDDLLNTLKATADKDLTGRKDAYVLKDFTTFINESKPFQKYLNSFKEELIKEIFPAQQYVNICQRISFFYSVPGNPPPPEPFCMKITRLLFTQAPPPYKYDYCIPNPSNQSFDDMICAIKKGYGFDIRSSRSSRSVVSRKSLGRLSTTSNTGRMKRLSKVPLTPIVNRKSTKIVPDTFDYVNSGTLISTKDLPEEYQYTNKNQITT